MIARILIVDDEQLNQATLESFLAGDGYDLHFASSGEEACAMARAVMPDLILLDVMMPDMNGFEVCRDLRADPVMSRIPIIFITALSDEASRIEGLREGADDFLSKPCRREELRARVRTVVSLNRFRAIAEEQARFQQLYDLAPSAIVLMDQQGDVVRANPNAEALLALPPGRPLPSASFLAGFTPENAKRVREVMAFALQKKPPKSEEVRWGTGDAERIMRVRSALIPGGDQQLVMVIFDDVTEEVRARVALEIMNTRLDALVEKRTRELEEANGLLMSYASFVSHDLRSPLAVVKGYLSMMHEGAVPMNAHALPMVANAYEGTVIMQEMIENILRLAQSEHSGEGVGSNCSTQPASVINRVWRQVRLLHPDTDHRFILGELPEVGVSGAVIERIFFNLFGNALKYSAQAKDPTVEVGAVQSAALPTLFISDNGVGFDAREADRLFVEFSRLGTAAKTEGFGLGLSLVARLVRAYGGKIWAEGSVGVGATFFVQLPAPSRPLPSGSSESVSASVTFA
jgi:PAS domain S-box-containing protein